MLKSFSGKDETMRITLHDYITDPGLPQKDGVNLAHENIAALMRGQADGPLQVTFHDFNRLLEDEAYARNILDHTDCVISNIGPHAHYYFYLREQYGLNFRIVRDVRTAIWSSYLLQEYLCAPLLQTQDILMVASHYTRGIYEKIFPNLKDQAILRCYPLTVAFPSSLPTRATKRSGDPIDLGYIGRLSEDKNFPDLIDLLITLNRREPGGFRLLACGDIHSPSCHPDRLSQRLREALGPGDHFVHFPSRKNGEIWELYQRFDVMVFPSTSNLETLGRVLVEASYAGVPVISGAHAAAPELMPDAALCPVDYVRGRPFDTHYDHSLGQVDINAMVALLVRHRWLTNDCHLEYRQHPEKFLQALTADADRIRQMEPLTLKPAQAAFIDSMNIQMPVPLTPHGTSALIRRLMSWFTTLQKQGSVRRQDLVKRLERITRHPHRTSEFLRKANATRGDFTNVGGIDIEICHVARFYPAFSLINLPSTSDVGRHDSPPQTRNAAGLAPFRPDPV